MLEHELDRFWKTVVNTMQEGIMIIDKSGSIMSVNKSFESITGFSKSDLIGSKCSILKCNIFDIARDMRGDQWCILFNTGNFNMKRCMITKKNGEIINVLKNASLLYDSNGELIGAVESITDISEIIEKDNQIAEFRNQLLSENDFHGIIGNSSEMNKIFYLISNASISDAPVIIYGESGTGKELVSKAIHERSNRSNKPFVKINCAALSESLLESELFGHVKGAYTGAYKDREGRFETANGGTIFLDEIGDIPLSTQVKLLRVLEDKIVEKVGDSQSIPVDVQIISATNRNLKDLIDKGLFRKDLYYRINVVPISLPPLRDRIEDIPLIAESFFNKIRLKSQKNIQGIANETMDILIKYDWPGNVRELKSAFEYSFVICQESIIQPYHLPANIYSQKIKSKNIVNNNEQKKMQLLNVLEQVNGNQSEAARLLGISRVTVWNRMKKYGIKTIRHHT